MKKHASVLFLILFSVNCIVHAQDSEATFKKAEQKYNAHEYPAAIALYTQAIKEDPSKKKFYVRRGFCFSLTSDFDSAIEDYSKVIEMDPKYKWAYVSRGSARNKIAAYKDAIRDFDMAIQLDPKDGEAYNNRGFAKKGIGDMEGACQDWTKARKLGVDECKIILENNHCK